MTLLICVFAAIASTVKWYTRKDDTLCLGTLCMIYWGASLMWFVDALFEYAELHADYFAPAAGELINDSFLGLSAVALGLILWLIVLLIKDPRGVVRASFSRKI